MFDVQIQYPFYYSSFIEINMSQFSYLFIYKFYSLIYSFGNALGKIFLTRSDKVSDKSFPLDASRFEMKPRPSNRDPSSILISQLLGQIKVPSIQLIWWRTSV